MTHEDAGHYAAKHKGAKLNEKIAVKVREKMADDILSCGAAHVIAEELGVAASEVGITLDLLEVRIGKCQMGLFGYGEKKRIVKPADKVEPELQKEIESLLVDGRLPCKAAWELAKKFQIKRLDLANACEKLKIKINSCQIGSF
jgi:hypothetical protein